MHLHIHIVNMILNIQIFSNEYHYHVNANKDETIYKVPPSSNFSLDYGWSLELYEQANCVVYRYKGVPRLLC